MICPVSRPLQPKLISCSADRVNSISRLHSPLHLLRSENTEFVSPYSSSSSASTISSFSSAQNASQLGQPTPSSEMTQSLHLSPSPSHNTNVRKVFADHAKPSQGSNQLHHLHQLDGRASLITVLRLFPAHVWRTWLATGSLWISAATICSAKPTSISTEADKSDGQPQLNVSENVSNMLQTSIHCKQHSVECICPRRLVPLRTSRRLLTSVFLSCSLNKPFLLSYQRDSAVTMTTIKNNSPDVEIAGPGDQIQGQENEIDKLLSRTLTLWEENCPPFLWQYLIKQFFRLPVANSILPASLNPIPAPESRISSPYLFTPFLYFCPQHCLVLCTCIQSPIKPRPVGTSYSKATHDSVTKNFNCFIKSKLADHEVATTTKTGLFSADSIPNMQYMRCFSRLISRHQQHLLLLGLIHRLLDLPAATFSQIVNWRKQSNRVNLNRVMISSEGSQATSFHKQRPIPNSRTKERSHLSSSLPHLPVVSEDWLSSYRRRMCMKFRRKSLNNPSSFSSSSSCSSIPFLSRSSVSSSSLLSSPHMFPLLGSTSLPALSTLSNMPLSDWADSAKGNFRVCNGCSCCCQPSVPSQASECSCSYICTKSCCCCNCCCPSANSELSTSFSVDSWRVWWNWCLSTFGLLSSRVSAEDCTCYMACMRAQTFRRRCSASSAALDSTVAVIPRKEGRTLEFISSRSPSSGHLSASSYSVSSRNSSCSSSVSSRSSSTPAFTTSRSFSSSSLSTSCSISSSFSSSKASSRSINLSSVGFSSVRSPPCVSLLPGSAAGTTNSSPGPHTPNLTNLNQFNHCSSDKQIMALRSRKSAKLSHQHKHSYTIEPIESDIYTSRQCPICLEDSGTLQNDVLKEGNRLMLLQPNAPTTCVSHSQFQQLRIGNEVITRKHSINQPHVTAPTLSPVVTTATPSICTLSSNTQSIINRPQIMSTGNTTAALCLGRADPSSWLGDSCASSVTNLPLSASHTATRGAEKTRERTGYLASTCCSPFMSKSSLYNRLVSTANFSVIRKLPLTSPSADNGILERQNEELGLSEPAPISAPLSDERTSSFSRRYHRSRRRCRRHQTSNQDLLGPSDFMSGSLRHHSVSLPPTGARYAYFQERDRGHSGHIATRSTWHSAEHQDHLRKDINWFLRTSSSSRMLRKGTTITIAASKTRSERHHECTQSPSHHNHHRLQYIQRSHSRMTNNNIANANNNQNSSDELNNQRSGFFPGNAGELIAQDAVILDSSDNRIFPNLDQKNTFHHCRRNYRHRHDVQQNTHLGNLDCNTGDLTMTALLNQHSDDYNQNPYNDKENFIAERSRHWHRRHRHRPNGKDKQEEQKKQKKMSNFPNKPDDPPDMYPSHIATTMSTICPAGLMKLSEKTKDSNSPLPSDLGKTSSGTSASSFLTQHPDSRNYVNSQLLGLVPTSTSSSCISALSWLSSSANSRHTSDTTILSHPPKNLSVLGSKSICGSVVTQSPTTGSNSKLHTDFLENQFLLPFSTATLPLDPLAPTLSLSLNAVPIKSNFPINNNTNDPHTLTLNVTTHILDRDKDSNDEGPSIVHMEAAGDLHDLVEAKSSRNDSFALPGTYVNLPSLLTAQSGWHPQRLKQSSNTHLPSPLTTANPSVAKRSTVFSGEILTTALSSDSSHSLSESTSMRPSAAFVNPDGVIEHDDFVRFELMKQQQFGTTFTSNSKNLAISCTTIGSAISTSSPAVSSTSCYANLSPANVSLACARPARPLSSLFESVDIPCDAGATSAAFASTKTITEAIRPEVITTSSFIPLTSVGGYIPGNGFSGRASLPAQLAPFCAMGVSPDTSSIKVSTASPTNSGGQVASAVHNQIGDLLYNHHTYRQQQQHEQFMSSSNAWLIDMPDEVKDPSRNYARVDLRPSPASSLNPGSELALVGSLISGSHSSQSSVSPAFGSIHSTAVSSNLGLSSFLFSGHRTHPFTHSQHQPQTHHLTLKQTRPNHDELSNPPTPTPTPTTTTITNITIPNINSTKACEPSPYVNSSVLNLGFSRPLLKTSIPSCIRVSKCSTVSCSGGTSNARRSSPLTTAIHSSGCGPSNHPAGFLVPQTNLSGSEEMAQPRNSRRRHSHSISSATPSAYQHHQHPLPPSFLPVTKETGLSGRYNDSTIVLNYVPVIATPASVLGHSGHSLGSSAVTDQDVTRAPSGRVCTGSFIDSPLECCFRSPTTIDQMSQSMTETYSASLSIASCATTQVTPVGAEILAASGIEEKRSISTLVGGNSLSSLSAVAASIPATGLVSDAISVCPQVEKLVPVNVSQLHNNGDGLVNYTQVDFARTLALGEVNGDISGTEVATGHGHCHGNQEHSLHRGRGSTGPGHHHLQQHHRHQNAEGLSGMEISFSKTANSHAIANAAASACADSSITDVEYCSPLSSSPQALRHHHQQNHFQQQHHQMAIALVNGLAGKVNRSASVRKALSRMIGRGGPNSRKKAERSSIVSTDSAGNG